MKAHKYWSVGALITMLGTFYTGYKKQKSSHKYFALSSMLGYLSGERGLCFSGCLFQWRL